jgi:hypothetical protein
MIEQTGFWLDDRVRCGPGLHTAVLCDRGRAFGGIWGDRHLGRHRAGLVRVRGVAGDDPACR